MIEDPYLWIFSFLFPSDLPGWSTGCISVHLPSLREGQFARRVFFEELVLYGDVNDFNDEGDVCSSKFLKEED